MSEYKTLKEWFGEATRGDGRKFALDMWGSQEYFEPIFAANASWFGIDENGDYVEWGEESFKMFKEWHPPKKTKKIKMYMPTLKYCDGLYRSSGFFSSVKGTEGYSNPVCGWIETEVEVDDE